MAMDTAARRAAWDMIDRQNRAEVAADNAPRTPPRDNTERAVHAERLLARIMQAAHVGGTYFEQLTAVRQELAAAGYHPGQVDDDGLLVVPPHDDTCVQCRSQQ